MNQQLTALNQPTVIKPFGQNAGVEINLFGYGEDWRFSDPEGKDLSESSPFIAAHVLRNDIRNLFVPRPAFTSVVAQREVLMASSEELSFDSGTVEVFRGPASYRADAASIMRREAFFIASGDCPTLLVYHPKLPLYCAHAGRECLWDKEAGKGNGTLPRKFRSVVDAIMDEIPKELKPEVRAFITCGIKARHFRHEEVRYKEMLDHFDKLDLNFSCIEGKRVLGCLSLVKVIIAQLTEYGVPMDMIGYDSIDTYADCQPDGVTPMWWSHRRFMVEGQKGQDGRNGVLIIRK